MGWEREGGVWDPGREALQVPSARPCEQQQLHFLEHLLRAGTFLAPEVCHLIYSDGP